MSLYAPPADLPSEVFAVMPERFRMRGGESAWGRANKSGQQVECFLEGPAFDRAGNLYVTDIPYGRIFRISPQGEWELVVQYEGWPNGLKIHRDGTVFVADYMHGILRLDPASGTVSSYLTHRHSEGFKGVNDLFFDRDGLLYFTDQGQSGMHDPTGRVYRFDPASGRTDCLIANGPSPNGVVVSPDGAVLYVAMTRGNAVWRLPILADGGTSKVGIFATLAGGISGADGLAVDEDGQLFVCDAGNGCVWVFSRYAEPVYRIRAASSGRTVTNLAFGGEDRKSLFITESATGTILHARMDVPGQPLFSHT